MSRSQYQIHAEVRRVLARHWIDLDRIQFGVYRDVLRVSGELYHTSQYPIEGTASILEVLHGEFMRIHEVRCVAFDLGNWERGEDGRWQVVGGTGQTPALPDDGPTKVYEMSEPEPEERK